MQKKYLESKKWIVTNLYGSMSNKFAMDVALLYLIPSVCNFFCKLAFYGQSAD